MSTSTIIDFPVPDIPSNPSLIMGEFNATAKDNIQEHFTFRPVAQIDVRAIVALVGKVRDNLSDAQKHFLKDKDAAQLEEHLLNHFPAVAIFKESKLVGFAMVSPQNENTGAANLPAQFNKGHYMSIGTVAVDPDFSGFGLGQKLVELAFKNAVAYAKLYNKKDIKSVIGKVAGGNEDEVKDNGASQAAFKRAGFNPYTGKKGPEIYRDPAGYNCNVWVRPLNIKFNSAESPYNLGPQTISAGVREQRIVEARPLPTRGHH